MIRNTMSSVKRDAAIRGHAEAARQQQQRLESLFPADEATTELLILDGPGESRPSGLPRHNNDPVSFRHNPVSCGWLSSTLGCAAAPSPPCILWRCQASKACLAS